MTNEEQKMTATAIQDILWMFTADEVAERLYTMIDDLDLSAAMRDINSGYDSDRSSFEEIIHEKY